jgi:hypothetical protein
MAAAMAQALNDHDHLKRSTDMPLFFGRKKGHDYSSSLDQEN